MNKCRTCKFWMEWPTSQASDPAVQVGRVGSCHRYPPRLPDNVVCHSGGIYVGTHEENWCGEHRQAIDQSDQRQHNPDIFDIQPNRGDEDAD